MQEIRPGDLMTNKISSGIIMGRSEFEESLEDALTTDDSSFHTNHRIDKLLQLSN